MFITTDEFVMPFLALNDIKIFYEESCTAENSYDMETILFLHGLGSCGQDWQDQVDFFSKNFRCITVDLRGHGKSDRAVPCDIPTLAADVISLIKFLEIPALHLVGISLGGMVAFQIAVEKPELLRSLTVVNALPELVLRGLKQHWMFYSRILLVKFLGMKIFAKVLARKLFPQKNQQELRRKFSKNFLQNDKKFYLTLLESMMGWSVVNRLRSITCKTLFIAAEHDYTTLSDKKFFAQKIGAKIVEIKNSHHAVPFEKPEEFNKILQDFLHT